MMTLRTMFFAACFATAFSVIGSANLAAAEMKHGFHATMQAKPGKGDELVKLLLAAPALSNEDCVVFLVGQSASDKDVVFVTEGWTTKDAHSKFVQGNVAQSYISKFPALVEGDGVYVDQIPVGGKAQLR